MKLQKLPAVHQNLMVAFAERSFIHWLNGRCIASGTILRALNSECLEAHYCHAGPEGEREGGREGLVLLYLPLLHYDGATESGFVFGDPVHDYSDLE
jgi:hypothetical protein